MVDEQRMGVGCCVGYVGVGGDEVGGQAQGGKGSEIERWHW